MLMEYINNVKLINYIFNLLNCFTASYKNDADFHDDDDETNSSYYNCKINQLPLQEKISIKRSAYNVATCSCCLQNKA